VRPVKNFSDALGETSAAIKQTEYHPGVARRTTIRAAVRKRGNPYWGHAMPLPPAVPTEFELQVRHLRLTPKRYTYSAELRRWCWQNRNRVYIPEWLLGEWHIIVDPHFSGAA
jgi:hypothetical protein